MRDNDVPELSVITAVYNRAAVVAQAVESVMAQNVAAIEHIVVDGGSTDGTLEVLARYPHLRIVSRPDEGMYDALNRGLMLARGEIIGFLNSDDLYRPGALHDVLAFLRRHPHVDAVAGRAEYFLERPRREPWVFRRTTTLTTSNLWQQIVYGDPAFNAWFFRRRVFERVGMFDTAYRIAGDRDFLIRFALGGLQVAGLPRIVYAYRVHSDSLSLSTSATRFLAVADEWLALAEHYLPLLPAEGQRWMRQAVVRDTITAASRSLRQGKWRRAALYARQGWRYSPWWLVLFVRRSLGGIWRLVGRRLGWYPPF